MFGRLITTVVLILVFSTQSWAGVDIPQKHWVPNLPGGYCAYAAAETVGKFLGIKSLYAFKDTDGKEWGLRDWYARWPSRGASDDDLHSCLTNLNVKYSMYHGMSIQWLQEQLDKNQPIIVSSPWSSYYHAYVVCDLDKDWVKIIDSNKTKKYSWISRSWFEQNWGGWALIIHKS